MPPVLVPLPPRVVRKIKKHVVVEKDEDELLDELIGDDPEFLTDIGNFDEQPS